MRLLEIIFLTITCDFAEKEIPKWEKIVCTIIFSFLNLVSIISLGVYAIFIKEVGYTKRIIGGIFAILICINFIYIMRKAFRKN